MNGRWKLGVAALVGVAIAVPATVLARGDVNATGSADNFLADSVADVSTNSTNWKPVDADLSLPETGQSVSVNVSAQMTKGEAKFRLAQESGGLQPAGLPESVLFSSKASNSFAFGNYNSCPRLVVEWKRVGDTKAEAAQVSTLSVYQSSVCV